MPYLCLFDSIPIGFMFLIYNIKLNMNVYTFSSKHICEFFLIITVPKFSTFKNLLKTRITHLVRSQIESNSHKTKQTTCLKSYKKKKLTKEIFLGIIMY